MSQKVPSFAKRLVQAASWFCVAAVVCAIVMPVALVMLPFAIALDSWVNGREWPSRREYVAFFEGD